MQLKEAAKKWKPIHIPRGFADKIDELGPHFVICDGKNPKVGGKGWQEKPMFSKDSKIHTWTLGGRNYGIVGGNGLNIADSDSKEVEEAIENSLPETLTILTGSGQKHFYYDCTDCEDWRPVLFDKEHENIGNIQGKGKMVVGPGSIHPEKLEKYKVYKDVPLARVTKSQIEDALKDYLVPKKVYSEAEEQAFKEKEEYNIEIGTLVDLDKLPIKRENKHQGPHPIHGSTGGTNFEVDLDKNSWFCFRHWVGGGPLSWLAVKHGLIKCEEAGAGALRGETFKRVLKLAKEQGLIKEEPSDIGFLIYFDHDGNFQPVWLANDLKRQYYFKTPMDTKIVWSYHPEIGVWKPDGEAIIQGEAEKRLGEQARKYRINEVVFNIQVSTYITRNEFQCPLHLIAVKNGMLNIETQQVEPFNPVYYAKAALPVTYDPTADCPKIKRAVREIVGDAVKTIQQYAGYCLYRKYIFHKALFLLGGGANGKSTLLALIGRFLGKENITSVTLQDLCFNRFAPAQLYGKLADISSDLPNKDLTYTEKFKSATGRDFLTCEYKYHNGFPFLNYAKLIYSANQIPKTTDDTLAFFRRWLIIPCDNVFIGQKADKKILEKLTTEEELSGLLNWALQGLNTLLTEGVFTEAPTETQIRTQWYRSSNSTQAFIEECVKHVNNPDIYVAKDDLFREYITWCKHNKLPTKDQASLTKVLKQIIPQVEEMRARHKKVRVRAWRYIKIQQLGPGGPPSTPNYIEKKIVEKKVFEVDHPDLNSNRKIEDAYFPTCYYCGQPIHEDESRTNDPSSHKPVHMRCYREMKEGRK